MSQEFVVMLQGLRTVADTLVDNIPMLSMYLPYTGLITHGTVP